MGTTHNYWVCQNCQTPNTAGTPACRACGFGRGAEPRPPEAQATSPTGPSGAGAPDPPYFVPPVEEAVARCPRCGTTRTSVMRFCPGCGLDFGQPWQATNDQTGPRVTTSQRRAKWLLLAGVVLVVVVALGVGGLLFTTVFDSARFAPDDLALTIPREVAGQGIDVERVDVSEMDAGGLEASRQLVISLGREPEDLRVARAWSWDRAVFVLAMRVAGVEATRLAEAAESLDPPLPGRSVTSETIAGKGVRRTRTPGYTGFSWRYPVGEVLYTIGAETDEDEEFARSVLDALP